MTGDAIGLASLNCSLVPPYKCLSLARSVAYETVAGTSAQFVRPVHELVGQGLSSLLHELVNDTSFTDKQDADVLARCRELIARNFTRSKFWSASSRVACHLPLFNRVLTPAASNVQI